jgi:site-specific recombinase XerD
MAELLESLRASFNRRLRAEGKADRTVVLYGQSITYFSSWLAQQGQPAELSSLTRDNAIAWLDSLRERGHTSGTIRTRWRGLRRFTLWLLGEDIIDTDPLAGIKVDKPEPPPVPVFSDDELTALVAACRGKAFIDRRDEVIIRLLLDCGLRVSELTGINLADIDLDAAAVEVTGKGSRVRSAYFGSRTAVALDRYVRARRDHRHASSPALLLGERGRFTPDGVRERLKVRAELAGLDAAKVHPHRFRHTVAHDWRLAGGDGQDLKRLMGWRSDSMLERYGASAADHRARESSRRLKRGDRI